MLICNNENMPKYAIKNVQEYANICRNLQMELCTNMLKYAKENIHKYANICRNMQ